MSIAIAVVGHHERQGRAEDLALRLGAELVLDDGTHGETPNHFRAWQQLALSAATHACVIQDDALPIESFLTDAEEACKHRRDALISFYVGRQRPQAAQVEEAVKRAKCTRASWLIHPELLWGVAVLMPTRLILDVLSAATTTRPYDRRLGHGWAARTGRPVLYTWPSLVDHDDTVPQLTADHPRRAPGRTAWQINTPTWFDRTVLIA